MTINPHPTVMLAMAEARRAALHADAARLRLVRSSRAEARRPRLPAITAVIAAFVATLASRIASL
jgi:hypothetical protein